MLLNDERSTRRAVLMTTMAVLALAVPAMATTAQATTDSGLLLGGLSLPLNPDLFGDEEDPDPQPASPSPEQPDTPEHTAGEPLQPNGASSGSSTTSSSPVDEADTWIWFAGLGLAMVGVAGVVQLRRRGDQPRSPEAGTAPPLADTVERDPVDHPGAPGAMLLGRRALERGRLTSAIEWFETAIELEPKAPMPHFCLGLCLERLERYEAAVDAFRATCVRQPENGEARYYLARSLAEAGRSRESMDELSALIDSDREQTVEAVQADESFDGLRDHPRFQQLIGKMQTPTEVEVQFAFGGR